MTPLKTHSHFSREHDDDPLEYGRMEDYGTVNQQPTGNPTKDSFFATPKTIKFGKTQSKIVIGAWIFYQVSNNQELIKKRGHLHVVWMIA